MSRRIIDMTDTELRALVTEQVIAALASLGDEQPAPPVKAQDREEIIARARRGLRKLGVAV